MSVCKVCGSVNRPVARCCARCGTALDSRVCPGCGHANRGPARFCALCGKALILVCVACGHPNRLHGRFCQHCGRPLLHQCPHCQSTVPPGVRVCHRCGLDPTSAQRTVTDNTLIGDRYRIVRPIARGGMGAVFLVRDERQSGLQWALKELAPDQALAGDMAAIVDTFRREAQILRTLRHPNLVKVVDSFTFDGKEYMVMEFVEGQTLDSVTSNGQLDEAQVLAFAFQLCDVLEYLHSRQPPIIYRDLKPGNVMVETRSGILKLIDFGIVRFYKPGQRKDTHVLGTPGFAPPEQYGNNQTDVRADIFALGVTLHVLLTNYDVAQNLWNFPPVTTLNADVSRRMEEVIGRATQVKVEKRYTSVAELRAALLRCRGGKQIAQHLPTAGLIGASVATQ